MGDYEIYRATYKHILKKGAEETYIKILIKEGKRNGYNDREIRESMEQNRLMKASNSRILGDEYFKDILNNKELEDDEI